MVEIQLIVVSAEIITGIILAILFIQSRIPKETIEQQGKLIEALTQRQTELLAAHVTNEKAISELQGQIKVYKELPLRQIADSLKILETLPQEFQRISDQNQEKIIQSFQNVTEQHVDNQTVGGKVTNLRPATA